jgi:hypothetical protein
MTRYRVMVAVLTLLALPLGAGTEQTVIRPEANWTTTAPPRGTLTSGALGPRIVMQSPQLHETRVERTIETVTPLDLLILFEANRAPVDMDSLQPEFAVYRHLWTRKPCICGVHPLKRPKIHRYMNRSIFLDTTAVALYIRRHVLTNNPTATQARSRRGLLPACRELLP